MSRRWRLRLGVLACVPALTLLPAGAASAHPLGNFTVNHYDGLVLTPHAVHDLAVIDAAEIPTQQAMHSVDTDHDGTVAPAERSAYALNTCTRLASALDLRIDGGRPSQWHIDRASFAYRPGAAGLLTSRLECGLTAHADFSKHADVRFADAYDADRIGWHEITARPDGTHLLSSPVPAASVTDELRHYPNDLLSSPLNVRQVAVHVEPGTGRSTVVSGAGHIPGASRISRLVEPLNRLFAGLAGARHLTVGVGLLAVLVSLLLGASHAALPGHGKTVMAAYLAGKRGSVRDAVVVGATVTITHTVGVLLLGLALTASSSLAGEKVTGDLGVASGALVAVIGIGLLTTALRRTERHEHHDHDHRHDHDEHQHDHGHPRRRLGLVGMGVAGGLVPSPSALVVLLGAVALGRTWFGVLLVLAYGVGMAATLTAAGLLLVRLSSRWAGRFAGRLSGRLSTATPIMTAGLVVVVGLGLAARSLATV